MIIIDVCVLQNGKRERVAKSEAQGGKERRWVNDDALVFVFCFCGYGGQDLAGKGVGGETGEGNVVNPEPDTQATT